LNLLHVFHTLLHLQVARCIDYPPDGVVTFSDISIFYDGVKASAPVFSSGVVDEVCGFKATALNASTVQITWNPKAADPSKELIARDQGEKQAKLHIAHAVAA
jgi:hypothetical protein